MKKNVILGVTGGIAAYKSADIIGLLKREDYIVDIIMTKSACEFITPLTLQTLSKRPVIVDMFELPDPVDVKHISLAQKADLILVAPATANIIGKIANGIADDMLSTTIMASKAPVVFACAMNEYMYENPIVQDNISKLKKYGYMFIEPDEGMLACGVTGKGKLAKPDKIVEFVIRLFKNGGNI
jgi:phosphopantothenoylcysteine decarboxylase / phosphopantothenate---cysteine ligase